MEFVSGRRPVWEALQAGKRDVHKLWIVQGTGGGIVEKILESARAKGVPVEWAPRVKLNRMAGGHHQGVLAQVSATAYEDLDAFLRRLDPQAGALLLGLDEIQDP